jgi:hypothetical protein
MERATISDLDVNLAEEPAVWPVILWVAFQVKARYVLPQLPSTNIDALLSIIEAQTQADKHIGFWQWDDTDEKMLRETSFSQEGAPSSRIDCYPQAWREYIQLLDPRDWARLKALTHQTPRPRLTPTEYETGIRVGAILLWISSNSIPTSQHPNTSLTLNRFIADLVERMDNHHVSQALPHVSLLLVAFHKPVFNLL